MAAVSPSKYMSLEHAKASAEYYSMSPTGKGKEYDAEELQALVHEKGERYAQAELTGWLKGIMNPVQATNDGMLELLVNYDEQTKEDIKMAIEIVEDSESTADILKKGLAGEPITSRDAVRLRAEIDNICSEMNGFRTEVFSAKTDMEEMRKTMAEVVAARSAPKVMKVDINGVVNKLSRPAVSYLGDMLTYAKLGQSIALIGPAGCGKSVAMHQLGEALGLRTLIFSCSEDTTARSLMGLQLASGLLEAQFCDYYENGGLFCLDELDRTTPGFLPALNNALASDTFFNQLTQRTIKRHKDFICVVAMNTFGMGADRTYVSANCQDGAGMDRFERVVVDYCDVIEKAVCPDENIRRQFQTARKKLRELKANYIVSTRRMASAYAQSQAGMPMHTILSRLVAGWPEQLVKQCGLDAPLVDDSTLKEIAAELDTERKRNEKLKASRSSSSLGMPRVKSETIPF